MKFNTKMIHESLENSRFGTSVKIFLNDVLYTEVVEFDTDFGYIDYIQMRGRNKVQVLNDRLLVNRVFGKVTYKVDNGN